MAASKWDRAGGQRSWLITTTSDPPAVSMDQLTVTALNLTREKIVPPLSLPEVFRVNKDNSLLLLLVVRDNSTNSKFRTDN